MLTNNSERDNTMFRKMATLLFIFSIIFTNSDAAKAQSLEKVSCSEAVRGFFFLPLYVAHGLKFFEQQGLDVTIDSAQGGPLAMQALVAGQVQFCATGHGQVANMYAEGKSTKIVNLMQDKCTFYLVGRPEIKEIKALKGKTVGCTKVGAETFAVGRYLAAREGLDPEKDIIMIGVGGIATMASAMENDRVQAVVAFQPLTSKLIADGKGTLLAKLNTKQDSLKWLGSPDYSFSVIQVTDEYIKNHPDTVQKFVTAIVAAEKWLLANPADEIAKVLAPYFSGMDPGVIKTSVDQDREAFSATGIVSQEGHTTAVKVFRDAGILKEDVPFDAIVNNSFTEKASR
jgi:NitT/TauT family transport system substrate-binding protein